MTKWGRVRGYNGGFSHLFVIAMSKSPEEIIQEYITCYDNYTKKTGGDKAFNDFHKNYHDGKVDAQLIRSLAKWKIGNRMERAEWSDKKLNDEYVKNFVKLLGIVECCPKMGFEALSGLKGIQWPTASAFAAAISKNAKNAWTVADVNASKALGYKIKPSEWNWERYGIYLEYVRNLCCCFNKSGRTTTLRETDQVLFICGAKEKKHCHSDEFRRKIKNTFKRRTKHPPP